MPLGRVWPSARRWTEPSGVETVDAVPVELGRLGGGEAVRRIGEEGGAARVVDDVVGAVEAPPLVTVGQRDPGAVGLDPRDAAVAVLAQNDAAVEIEGQPIRSALPAGLQIGQEHRVEEHARPVRLRPPVDGVAGDVAEEQVAAARIPDPHRPFDELEPVGDPLDRGIGRHQVVEARSAARGSPPRPPPPAAPPPARIAVATIRITPRPIDIRRFMMQSSAESTGRRHDTALRFERVAAGGSNVAAGGWAGHASTGCRASTETGAGRRSFSPGQRRHETELREGARGRRSSRLSTVRWNWWLGHASARSALTFEEQSAAFRRCHRRRAPSRIREAGITPAFRGTSYRGRSAPCFCVPRPPASPTRRIAAATVILLIPQPPAPVRRTIAGSSVTARQAGIATARTPTTITDDHRFPPLRGHPGELQLRHSTQQEPPTPKGKSCPRQDSARHHETASPITSMNTSHRLAPSAIRTPISRLRSPPAWSLSRPAPAPSAQEPDTEPADTAVTSRSCQNMSSRMSSIPRTSCATTRPSSDPIRTRNAATTPAL